MQVGGESIPAGVNCPVKVASRPSRKAVTPSRRSSVAMLSAIPCRSTWRWSASVLSRLCADQQLRHPHVVRRLRGQLLRLAPARRSISRSAGTTSATMPISCASAALSMRVVEEQLDRPRRAHHPGQEVGHAAVGRGPDPPVGAHERRLLGGDPGVAHQRQREARARGDAVDRRDHRIGDAAKVDDRLMQHVGAAAHVGRQVGARLLEPALEPGHVAPGRERPPLAGDDQGAERGAVGEPGRRRDQLGDQLGAHRVQHLGAVERQGADLAVDLEAEVASSSGGLGGGRRAHRSLPVRIGQRARSLTLSQMAKRRRDADAAASRGALDVEEQRSGCPTSPASTCSRTPTAGCCTWARRCRSASASPRTSPGLTAAGSEFIGQVASIDFLVTETEAEALLAEQQFIKRHRPRFNIRLRDDKSYPYVGVSLDEEFPRVYFTRERHRSGRVYFGPFSSARRVRETLDLLGKLFQYRTCEGPEPGRRSGVPCLDYYIKRCQAPCVGYIDREEYRRNIEAIIDFLSGRYRDVERDLERKMAEAAARRGVRAGGDLSRPPRGGPLADAAPQRRRGVAGDGRPDRGRHRRARRQRAGVPGPGRRARRAPRLLPRQRGGAGRGRGDRGVRRPVLLGGARGAATGGRGPRAAGPRRAARGGAVEPPRGPGRGAGRRARRQAAAARAGRAQRPARPGPGQAAGRAAPPAAGGRAGRLAGGARPGVAAGEDRGVRRLQPGPRPHRGLDGRVRGRGAEEGRLPPLQGPGRSPSPRLPRRRRRRARP